MQILQRDCLELMKGILDWSVDMVLAAPPYNIGVETMISNKAIKNGWNVIDGYKDCRDGVLRGRQLVCRGAAQHQLGGGHRLQRDRREDR